MGVNKITKQGNFTGSGGSQINRNAFNKRLPVSFAKRHIFGSSLYMVREPSRNPVKVKRLFNFCHFFYFLIIRKITRPIINIKMIEPPIPALVEMLEPLVELAGDIETCVPCTGLYAIAADAVDFARLEDIFAFNTLKPKLMPWSITEEKMLEKLKPSPCETDGELAVK